MTLLNEPISTWISIAAFLISLSTLLLAMRKQKHDERIMLASKVAEIKALHGEFMRAIDEIVERYERLENILRKFSPMKEAAELIETYGEHKSNMQNLRSEVKKTYSKLGFNDPGTKDPLVLSALVVESEGIRKHLEKEKSRLDETARSIELIIRELKERPKRKKNVSSNAPQKKSPKNPKVKRL
jgi:hypothetical protein